MRKSLAGSGPATVHDLSARLYPRTTQRNFWQTASSVQGPLDLLAARGEARETEGLWETC